MASPTDKTYFPPLEECLTGKNILVSWELVASALSDSSCDRLLSPAIANFLKDPFVHQLIRTPARVFGPRTEASTNGFNVKTSAIHVTPTANERFDIKQIKDDTSWLSKSAGINETAALRVVVLEFQSRPQSHLAGPLSTQDVANIQEAAGVGNAQASSFLTALNVSPAADDEKIWADFETEHQRHQRLLAAYLSERRHFMAAVSSLVTFLLHRQRAFLERAAISLRDAILRDYFAISDQPDVYIASFEALLPSYLAVLPGCVDQYQKGPASIEPADLASALEEDWASTYLTEAIHAMTVVYQVLDLTSMSRKFTTQGVVAQWFKFVDDYAFLDQLAGPNELLLPLRGIVCVISLVILHLDRALPYLDRDIELGENEDPYVDSPSILGDIHSTIWAAAEVNLPTASPVIFAWSLILHRLYVGYQERAERRDLAQNQRAQAGFELEAQRPPSGRRNSAGSIVSIEKSPYDLFLINSNLDREIQPVEKLAQTVTAGGQVHELIAEMAVSMGNSQYAAFPPLVGARMRTVFLDLLKQTYFVVGYKSESVTCLFSVLSAGQQYRDLSPRDPLLPNQSVPASALKDSTLMDYYVFQSLTRYPYEFAPFVNLCRTLSTSLCKEGDTDHVANLLLRMPSLTFELPSNWAGYELVHEEDNANTFQLTRDMPLFAPSPAWKRRLTDGESFCIPAGTQGRFVSDRGKIVLLEYEHSALALLGKRLEASLAPDAYDIVLDPLAPQELAEVISLLATIIRAEVLKSSDLPSGATSETGLEILRETSRALPRTKDIISVVCDILDTRIQEDLGSFDGAEMSVLSACLEFLHATLPLCPGRVWSYMARCELLNSDSKAGRLSMITGSLDLAFERFDLLASALRLFSSLVESAMTSAVQRKIEPGTLNSRQKGGENPWLGSSDKILSRVCLSIAQTAVDIFENSMTWRFQSEIHRSILTRDAASIMNNSVLYAFSIGGTDPSKGLTACLVPAANYVVESFLSPALGSLRFQPLLATVLVALQVPDSTLYRQRVQLVSERLVTVLDFMATLLRVAIHLDKPTAAIQNQIFKSVSAVVRLCAVRDCYRIPSYSLLGALVESTRKLSSEPPSLLGYLRPPISRSFIQLVSRLDRPFDREHEVTNTWKFFSAVLRHRQQWMAHCLLSGRTPREALLRYERVSRVSPDSVLAVALDKIKSLGSISSTEALAVLDFFTSAQNYWPWTIFAMQRDKDISFLDDFRSYVRNLKSPSVTSKSDAREAASQARIAAYIAEAFAMQLFHLRQMSQEGDFARAVINDLDYFLREGVQVSGYNTSLHVNFARNFSGRYSGCSLDEFKRTALKRQDLGPQYFYALDFAQTMLGFDGGWIGPRQNGFRQEMETANLNLSLVDAQVALFNAWELLLLELSVCLLPKNKTIAKQMLQVAEKCLESNQASQGPGNIFVRLAHSRANLALTLLQRLADCSLLPRDISQILAVVWSTISVVESPFGAEQLVYYRTLLKILYVVLRSSSHCANSDAAAKPGAADGSVGVTQLALSILDRVVAQGFRTLVTLVHESDSPTSPEDIALITAILQACLSLPDMDQCQGQIMNIMASYDVFHMATSLFSWADKLAENGDPVYGELALLFLLELSMLPVIAEQLACDGLLGHLTTANLVGFMRRPNVGPFAENVGAARCYGIWAKGMLPLLLNVLGPLGATIAPEVAFVLNQFPNLLQSSVERFEAPGLSRTAAATTTRDNAPQFVTLLAVSEVHSLALLARALADMRQNNTRDIAAVAWDGGGGALLENVEFWLASRKVLRERLLPLGSGEVAWRAARAAEGSGCESKLEEKVVAGLEAVRDVLSQQDVE